MSKITFNVEAILTSGCNTKTGYGFIIDSRDLRKLKKEIWEYEKSKKKQADKFI